MWHLITTASSNCCGLTIKLATSFPSRSSVNWLTGVNTKMLAVSNVTYKILRTKRIRTSTKTRGTFKTSAAQPAASTTLKQRKTRNSAQQSDQVSSLKTWLKIASWLQLLCAHAGSHKSLWSQWNYQKHRNNCARWKQRISFITRRAPPSTPISTPRSPHARVLVIRRGKPVTSTQGSSTFTQNRSHLHQIRIISIICCRSSRGNHRTANPPRLRI
jgi:hypothetical protein